MPVSEISLGTVQLGIPYGLNNSGEKTDEETAFRMLDIACDNGINWLDTAAAYGDSECVIGEWLKTQKDTVPFVATKVNRLDHSSLDSLRASLKEQVEMSKKRLGLEQIPLLMIHHCEEYLEDPENMRIAFDELKAKGDILLSGISAYAHHDYEALANSGFDAVQIPVNVFDWRQISNGGIDKFKDAGMIVFARSVYLQGLVFRTAEQLTPKMAFCSETIQKWEKICKRFDMSPGSLSLSFALSLPAVTSLVIGCRNEQQIKKTFTLYDEVRTLTEDEMNELRLEFSDTDERIITPSLW